MIDQQKIIMPMVIQWAQPLATTEKAQMIHLSLFSQINGIQCSFAVFHSPMKSAYIPIIPPPHH